MADVHSDIKPSGLNQKELVNLLGMLTYSLEGVCTKLDADGTVPLGGGATTPTYLTNCYTAIVNTTIEDCNGNRRGQFLAEHLFNAVSPGGITDAALLEWLYNYFNAIETLTEQLDADVLTDSDYEANVYTAYFLGIIENQDGNSLGNGITFYFRPGGVFNQKELVDLLYNITTAWSVLVAQLDNDVIVTDTDYGALWYTATILLRIENSAGNSIGNDRTDI